MEVFISYETTTGLNLATNLKEALTKVGISAFVAKEDIPKGTPDRQIIDDAIKDCIYFVVIINFVATYSDEVKREIKLAKQFGKEIIPSRPKSIERAVTNTMPIVSTLQQIDYESKEDLADQVVTEIMKRKRRKIVVPTQMEEAAATELSNVQSAVVGMMVDDNLTRLPHPVTVASNDMGAFPDATSVCGIDKISDPNGSRYHRGGDKNGYILFGHDITGDNTQVGLVNYVASRYTHGTYVVNAQGTVTQVTTGYE